MSEIYSPDRKALIHAQHLIMDAIRPRTPPVAIKFLKVGEKIPDGVEDVRAVRGFEPSVCHLHSIARHEELAVFGRRPDMSCSPGMILMGMYKPDMAESIADMGKPSTGLYTKDATTSKNFSGRGWFIPGEDHDAIIFSPLAKAPLTPDVVIQYVNPAQTLKLIRAWAFETGRHVDMSCSGRTGLCSEGIARAYIEKKPVASIPAGDRAMGFTQDDEMAFSMPLDALPKLLAGLEGQSGIPLLKYPPIPHIANNATFDLGRVPTAGPYYDKWLKGAKDKYGKK